MGNFAGQLWAFAVAMKEGDLVVLPRKLTSQIAIGRVTGPYEYRQVDDAFRHTRPVEWLQTDLPRTVFEQALLVRRVHDCLQHLTQRCRTARGVSGGR